MLFAGQSAEVRQDGVLLGVALGKGHGEIAAAGGRGQYGRAAHVDDHSAVHGDILEAGGVGLGGRSGIPPHQPQPVVVLGLVGEGHEGHVPAGVVGDVARRGQHIHRRGVLGDIALGGEIGDHLIVCTGLGVNGLRTAAGGKAEGEHQCQQSAEGTFRGVLHGIKTSL